MRVLSLTAMYPYPPYGGGESRVWEVATRLAERHDVCLITTGRRRPGSLPPGCRVVIESCSDERATIPAQSSGLSRTLGRVRSLLRGWPPVIEAAITKPAVDRILDLVRKGWPDVVVAEENLAGGFLRFLPPGLPRVWVKHSIYAVDAKQARARANRVWLRPYLLDRLVRFYEADTLRRADVVVVMAEEDAVELIRRYGPRAIDVVGCGADTVLLRWRPDPGTRVAAFVGNFGWQANADAADWLLKDIWPLVVARVPDARLRLIGNHLDPALASRARAAGIEVTGYVEDLPRALADVAVGLVPIRLGTGVRVKFLENLALGIPTVATRLGSRGTQAADGIHCLHAEEPRDFAAAVGRLMLDPPLRRNISEACRDLRAWVSWDARAREMEHLLLGLTGNARPAGTVRATRSGQRISTMITSISWPWHPRS